MISDFANYMNGITDLSPEEARKSFGFYDVEEMNNTIDGAKGAEGAKVAESHFKNVFDEFWGKHSAEELFY